MLFPSVIESNLTAAVRTGTVLTADGTPGVEGAWTTLYASTAALIEAMIVRAREVAQNAVDTSMVLDIAEGDVGGGNESLRVSNLLVGGAALGGSTSATHGRTMAVPVEIASTKSIRGRIQATQATDTVAVTLALLRGMVNLTGLQPMTTYGVTNQNGVAVTPGSGAYGSWAEIGTTGADHKLFIPSYEFGTDASVIAADVLVKIGYGATAPDVGGTELNAVWVFSQLAAEAVAGPFPAIPVYAEIPSGTKLWAAIASGETEARGIAIHAGSGTLVGAGGTTPQSQLGGNRPVRVAA